MSADLDVAIVGAGAAGIAAARALHHAGHSVLVIEALNRLGGRAHTMNIRGLPLDMGAGWLHSAERNPLTKLAEQSGWSINRDKAAWGQQWRDIDFSAKQQAQAWAAYENFIQRLHEAPPPSDCAGDALARHDVWRPFIDSLSGYINGAEIDQLSVKDFLAYDDASSENNWRLLNGYGTFIASLAEGLPFSLSTQVRSVAFDDGVMLETNRGAIKAKAAIIAASTNILAKGAIRFAPMLDDHLHAASKLPLGLADKVFLALENPDAVPPETHLLGRYDSAATGSYYLRPFGRPIVECFLGGAHAHALEDAGEDAAFAFVVGELRELLGADFVKSLRPLAVTRWAHEPTILGSYSHALPGHAGARAKLANPPHERLCFAGEACSAKDFSTAHGAWESGLAAASRISQAL